MAVGQAHAFVDGILQAIVEAAPARVHADFKQHVDDAGVLADGAPVRRGHARVQQDLRHRIARGRAGLARMGLGQVREEVGGMGMADVLQGAGDGVDQVLAADGEGHGWRSWRQGHSPCSVAPARSRTRLTATRDTRAMAMTYTPTIQDLPVAEMIHCAIMAAKAPPRMEPSA